MQFTKMVLTWFNNNNGMHCVQYLLVCSKLYCNLYVIYLFRGLSYNPKKAQTSNFKKIFMIKNMWK